MVEMEWQGQEGEQNRENKVNAQLSAAAKAIESMMKQAGIDECDPRLKIALLTFAIDKTREILHEAHSICEFSGRRAVTTQDVNFALTNQISKPKCDAKFMNHLASEVNAKNLPEIKHSVNKIRLPSNQHLLMQCDYAYKSSSDSNRQPFMDNNNV